MIDLERAVERAELTEKQVEALRLVYGEGMEQTEAGMAMGQSQPAVSQHISAAIRKIAAQM